MLVHVMPSPENPGLHAHTATPELMAHVASALHPMVSQDGAFAASTVVLVVLASFAVEASGPVTTVAVLPSLQATTIPVSAVTTTAAIKILR
jgi:hypothetical protein